MQYKWNSKQTYIHILYVFVYPCVNAYLYVKFLALCRVNIVYCNALSLLWARRKSNNNNEMRKQRETITDTSAFLENCICELWK